MLRGSLGASCASASPCEVSASFPCPSSDDRYARINWASSSSSKVAQKDLSPLCGMQKPSSKRHQNKRGFGDRAQTRKNTLFSMLPASGLGNSSGLFRGDMGPCGHTDLKACPHDM